MVFSKPMNMHLKNSEVKTYFASKPFCWIDQLTGSRKLSPELKLWRLGEKATDENIASGVEVE